MAVGGYTGSTPHHNINWANFNYAGTGMVNTGYTAPNLNPNLIPNQNYNTWTDPSGAAPNFNGKVTVDTASLTAFSQWVSSELGDRNSGPLADLIKQLQTVQVEPGSFYWADQIRSTVNGTGSGTGLATTFVKVINDLLDGLADISTGVKQLVQLYANTEDLNNAQATQLESDMANSFSGASGAFNTLGTASQSSGSGSGSGSTSG